MIWSYYLAVRDVLRYNRPENALMGFDGKTGKRLWLHHDIDQTFTPVTWRDSTTGKEYFITGDLFSITCIEPRSGKIIWRDERFAAIQHLVIQDDYLIVKRPDDNQVLTCVQLTATGAQKTLAITK